jgi:transcriptional regulator with XRE-family HTH domain
MLTLPPPNVRRALRTSAGLTLAELAADVGVAEATVFYWERGASPRRPAHRHQYMSLLAKWAEELIPQISSATRNPAGES